jgi:peptide/nickel transport system substrate-binding protein
MTNPDSDWLTPNRRRVLASLGGGGLAVLAGCSSGDGGGGGADTSTNASSDERTVTIGIAQGSWDLIPARDTDFVSNLVYTLIYDNIVNLTPDLKIVPELAEDYSRESDTQYVFKLRDGVKFHNGEPFTAEDVKYTYEWIQNNPNPRKNYVAPVSDVVVENDTTVRFDLSKPYAPFLYKIRAIMWPLSKAAIEKYGKSYNTNPVGTGPFRLTSWKSGSEATLEKYDNYWMNNKPTIETVVFRILPEASTKVTQLTTGTIDTLDTIPVQYASRVENAENVRLHQTAGVSSGRIDFNTQVEALANRKVRRALAWATDKQKIVDTVLQGYADPGKSVLPNSFPAYADEISDFSHPRGDVSKAKQLLSDAGYSNLSLKIKTSTRPAHKKTSTLLQSMWGKAGVDVRVQSLNGTTFFSQEKKGDFEVAVSNWTWFGDPDTLLYLYHSKGLNVWNIDNKELDAMIEKQRRTVDQQARRKIIRAIQKYVYEEAYSIYTYYPRRLQGVANRISGFAQYPNGSFMSLDKASVN